MSLFGEFRVPWDAFAFHDAIQREPDLIIEIERVVATEEILTPYFWISNVSHDDFEAAVADDRSIEQLRRLDEYDSAVLYRAEWTEHVETLLFLYTQVGASILEAKGANGEWMLRMRFDDQENLRVFNEYLRDENIGFTLERLYEIVQPRDGGRYALTQKQTDALTTAWEMGYFALPREATTKDVADALGIAPQSFSDRLRRAHYTLIENTLRVEGPDL